MRAISLLVLLPVAAAVAVSASGARSTAAPSQPAAAANGVSRSVATSRSFTFRAGKGERQFVMREREGVILLARITVPRGMRASVVAVIPHVGGSGVETQGLRREPALRCRHKGGYVSCTQSQEWCPMPAALWHFDLVKRSGPAGPIRVDWVVGPPPADG